MLWTKKKKIILIVVIIVFVAVTLLSTILAVYFAPRDIELTMRQRQILAKTFSEVSLGEKATPKRTIDSDNILNLLNYYGNEDIELLWKGIPDNQKPYTVLLLIPGNGLNPNNDGAIGRLESWADECERRGIPYAIQNFNGETHMESRLPIAYLEQRFASQHRYFYGLNGAELYNGVAWRGASEADQTEYIIDCIKLSAKYGAFFFWTDTNINYENGMIVDYIENSEALYSTLKHYSEYVCMLNKESFGRPSTYAVMQGLWLAGLIGNWGVASDWWHWQVDGDKKSLFGENDKNITNEWDLILSFPENMYVQSMMLVMSRGGTCFKAEAPNYSTSVAGNPVAGFEYALSPLIDRVISGKINIPTRQEVLAETKAIVLGGENWVEHNYFAADSNLYPSTGVAGVLALLPSNLRLEERAVFLGSGIKFIDYKMSLTRFQEIFGTVTQSSYMAAMGSDWYYINPVENERAMREGNFVPRVNSATHVSINAAEHTSAIINEGSDKLSFYISNYRTDKTQMQKDIVASTKIGSNWAKVAGQYMCLDKDGNPLGVDDSELREVTITIKGRLNGGRPQVNYITNKDGSDANSRLYEAVEIWDETNGILTIKIMQNGVVELDVTVDDSGRELTYANRLPIIESKLPNSNSVSELFPLTNDDQIITDKHKYTYYSYLQYNNAVERGKMLIQQRTGSVYEIAAAVEDLKTTKDNLVDISAAVDSLNKALSLDAATVTSFSYQEVMYKVDRMLRELLSVKKYKIGRTNAIAYTRGYANAAYDRDAEVIAVQRATDKLNEAHKKLVKI